MPDKYDIAIIGGGIIGVSAAAFLAEAGIRVGLFERDDIASAASGRNSGAIQHPFDPYLADLHRRTLALYHELVTAPTSSWALRPRVCSCSVTTRTRSPTLPDPSRATHPTSPRRS